MRQEYNIYLVGFMGTGKTTVGRELAGRLGLKFVDIDDLIVDKEKRSINDIFAESGEPYFRKLEKAVLGEVALKPNQVVACGGGIVIDPDNIAGMKKSGKIFALTASPETILERTKNDTQRPLLNTEDPFKKITELILKRQPYYAKADFFIDTSRLSVDQVTASIIDLLP